jgi:hypothetical protein
MTMKRFGLYDKLQGAKEDLDKSLLAKIDAERLFLISRCEFERAIKGSSVDVQIDATKAIYYERYNNVITDRSIQMAITNAIACDHAKRKACTNYTNDSERYNRLLNATKSDKGWEELGDVELRAELEKNHKPVCDTRK